MKISKIYSNKPDHFTPILLNPGLNVIFAEVKFPKDSEKDSHNLGKSTLIGVIDFLLLKQFSHTFFQKNQVRFAGFEFFIEIEISKDEYLTVRRDVDAPTKISFKKHSSRDADYRGLLESEWDHFQMSFERAKEALDGFLNLTAIKPYTYRQGVSFFLRTQSDFSSVFQLTKNTRGKHITWKPYLAHILGFDDSIVRRHYEVCELLKDVEIRIAYLRSGLAAETLSLDKVKAQLEIKSEQVNEISQQLDTFRFQVQEAKINEGLVAETETRISELNKQLYDLNFRIRKIQHSLHIRHDFDLAEVEAIYSEAKIYFSEQLKRDYADLVQFNEKLTKDRHQSLRETLKNLEIEKQGIQNELGTLDKQRSAALSLLGEEDTFRKYKILQNSLVSEKAVITNLEVQQRRLEEIAAVEQEALTLANEKDALRARLKASADASNAVLREIRKTFSSIVKDVLNVDSLLYVKPNEEGNFEFCAEIVRNAETLEPTSESEGTTYKKLLCIAFDIAVLEHYSEDRFFKFVYHDGALEGLDSRKKIKLIERVRKTTTRGIQYILSVIDTDLPRDETDKKLDFAAEEIVCCLNDAGERGRLFKMPTF